MLNRHIRSTDNSIQVIQDRGLKLVEKPNEADMKVFIESGIKVRNTLVGKLYSQKLLDEVIQHLNDFRKN